MTSARTLQSLLDSLREHGERPALLALGKKELQCWSFTKLANAARLFANGLVANGVKRGDSVALFAESRPEWIVAAIGVLRAGAVVVPLDIQFGDETLFHVLEDSAARAIVTTQRRTERIEKLALKEKPRLIVLDAPPDDERNWERFLHQEALQIPTVNPDHTAVLFYTSGTTGPPKGVPLSHCNIVSQLESIADMKIVGNNDRALVPLPLHHVYPFVVGMLVPLTLGLLLVLPLSLSGQQLLRALREGEVTVIVGVPRLYSALYAGINARVESSGRIVRGLFSACLAASALLQKWLGLRIGKLLFRALHKRFGENVRLLACGGSALDPKLASKLEALGWEVAIGYGLTETSPLLAFNLPGKATPGSVGKPFPGVKIRIDPRALEKAERIRGHEVGEILACGPNVFAGYLNLPDKTEEVFTSDGWFRTGDMGYIDDHDCLFVLGRISTLIVTESGEKVQTEDVEAAYTERSAIHEIGVLQKEGRLVALIVPARTDGGVDPASAIRAAVETVSKRLPSYQRIGEYAITSEALPRTRLGKIQRHRLAKRYEQAKEGGKKSLVAGPVPLEELSEEDRALLEDSTAQSVWELLARRYRDKRLTPDTSLQFDLGIDSLEWLNITLEIAECSGVELTEEAVARVETVRDLLREIIEGGEGKWIDPLAQPYEILHEKQRSWLKPLSPVAAGVARFLYGLNRLLMRLFFRLSEEGLENLPKDKAWVLTPNHVSYLDPFAIAAVLNWNQLRQTYWAGWAGIVSANPVMRFLSRLGKILPVEPTRAARTGLALGAIVLKNGSNLVWFPEGERSATGQLQTFKPGIGMLLERFPTPVLPVFIQGTYEALPMSNRFPRLRSICVMIGKPHGADELMRRGRGRNAHEQIANGLQEKVAEVARAASCR
ncbi:MAG TPA: AMP-binding protein [Chthoniobacterales bacterium]